MLSSNFQAKYLLFNEKHFGLIQEIVNVPSNFKTCEGKLLNGPLILKLGYEVVEFLKRGAPIGVTEALEVAFSSEAKDILEDLKRDFQSKVSFL